MVPQAGLITQTHNRFYRVWIQNTEALCLPKGELKRQPDPEYRLPVIGDQVDIQLTSERRRGIDGYILGIHPRTNALIRGVNHGATTRRVMAANLETVAVVTSAAEPATDWNVVDRYLVACHFQELHALLVVNKSDLGLTSDHLEEIANFRAMGFDVVCVSARGDQGRDALHASLGPGIALFTGPSGVGKSTLINWLIPDARLLTGEVTARHGYGKHTTTSSRLVRRKGDAWVADSPGIREFFPPLVPSDQVRFGFTEIAFWQRECRFSSCLHLDEPQCAVREAVRRGDIHPRRYASYAFLVQETSSV